MITDLCDALIILLDQRSRIRSKRSYLSYQVVKQWIDMSDSILQAGLQGVRTGIDQFGRAAGQIASASNSSSSTNSSSIAENLVEIKQAQQSVAASAAVIKAADETLGSLLDKLA